MEEDEKEEMELRTKRQTNKCRWKGALKILLTIKKNEIVPFAAIWMDPEIIILSKSEREGQEPYDII